MSTGRIAAVDGLRGIAVLLVIVGHLVGSLYDTDDPLARVLLVPANGGIGVTLFFVLSGYLITSILVREQGRTGRIHFGNFYIRRTLRILPAFYVFLGVVAVLSLTDVIEASAAQIASAGLFVWNYSPAADGWWLGHTWSLAVEEQFYLLWPLALVFLSLRRAVAVAVVYVLAAPAIRVLSYGLLSGQRDDVWMMFHARADALMVGCLLALLPIAYPEQWQRLQRLAQNRRTECLALAVLLVSSALESVFAGTWVLPFGYSFTALAAGCLLLVVVARETPSTFTRVLRWRPLSTVGLLSYSLYLWQQLFLSPDEAGRPIIDSAVLSVLALAVVATLSYLLVEKPFLSLKDRLQRPSRPRASVDGPTTEGATSDQHPVDAMEQRGGDDDPAIRR